MPSRLCRRMAWFAHRCACHTDRKKWDMPEDVPPESTSALPRGCCSGVSVSDGGGSDSAVIDSRYKTARQREILGGSTSGLTHSSAPKRRLRGALPSRLCRRMAWFAHRCACHADRKKWDMPEDVPPESTSALPRGCCSGVSMSAGGGAPIRQS